MSTETLCPPHVPRLRAYSAAVAAMLAYIAVLFSLTHVFRKVGEPVESSWSAVAPLLA